MKTETKRGRGRPPTGEPRRVPMNSVVPPRLREAVDALVEETGASVSGLVAAAVARMLDDLPATTRGRTQAVERWSALTREYLDAS